MLDIFSNLQTFKSSFEYNKMDRDVFPSQNELCDVWTDIVPQSELHSIFLFLFFHVTH